MKFRNLILLTLALMLVLAACTPNPAPTDAPLPLEATATSAPAVQPTATETPASPTSAATETPAAPPTETAIPTPAVIGPDNFPLDINPLTGKPAANPAFLDRRPLAVKINISAPRSFYRPPWGINQADIVYDYYQNGGYTRLFAIFYGNSPELIGPIRSARLLDHELVRMYSSIFSYGSADQRINTRILNAEYADRLVLEGAFAACPPTAATPLCRFDPGGHNHLLGDAEAMHQYVVSRGANDTRQPLNGMSFSNLIPQAGVPATQLFVHYSTDDFVRWDYDAASGRYLNFQDAIQVGGSITEQFEPLVDRLDNQQAAADNVVVVFVRHEYFVLPPSEIIDILLSGQGDAYALRDGQLFKVKWNRPTTYSVLSLLNQDGTAYTYKPGNTWYQIVGINSSSSQPADDVWRVEFTIP